MNPNQRVDVGGKSLDEVMANSEKQMRRFMEGNLLDFEDMIRCQGMAPDQYLIAMERARAGMEANLSENLARLRAWLKRGGETLN